MEPLSWFIEMKSMNWIVVSVWEFSNIGMRWEFCLLSICRIPSMPKYAYKNMLSMVRSHCSETFIGAIQISLEIPNNKIGTLHFHFYYWGKKDADKNEIYSFSFPFISFFFSVENKKIVLFRLRTRNEASEKRKYKFATNEIFW